MTSHLPRHIAIIMDGNGRWAKKRFLPRIAGHKAGMDAVKKIVTACADMSIKVLTLFAFSSENWRRPSDEVNSIMELFMLGLKREMKMLNANNVQMRFIGDRARFSAPLCEKIVEVEQLTKANTGLVLLIAADYGGQWDICQAVKQLGQAIEAGKLTSADITTDKIAAKLSFADLPDPDLFIRTSGEQRISNFILWQLAYAELYFTDVLWPDFSVAELEKALAYYANRERRFGYSSEQLDVLANDIT